MKAAFKILRVALGIGILAGLFLTPGPVLGIDAFSPPDFEEKPQPEAPSEIPLDRVSPFGSVFDDPPNVSKPTDNSFEQPSSQTPQPPENIADSPTQEAAPAFQPPKEKPTFDFLKETGNQRSPPPREPIPPGVPEEEIAQPQVPQQTTPELTQDRTFETRPSQEFQAVPGEPGTGAPLREEFQPPVREQQLERPGTDRFVSPRPEEELTPHRPEEFQPSPPPEEFRRPFFPREKRMVEVPHPPVKKFNDAGDFRDPFFLVRGLEKNSATILEPGATVDGVRFNSYKDSNRFIEQFYRESHFQLENVFGKVERQTQSDRGCLYCHRGIEEISENHPFKCTTCHGGNVRGISLPKAHEGMVPNPSDMAHADKFCGKCHAGQIEKMKRSTMTTAKKIINTTRYAWGAQTGEEGPYSLFPQEDEEPLPSAHEGHLVDGFLRAKCVRCHVQGTPPNRPGDYRATGCAACHMVYDNSGLTVTHDRTIQAIQQKDPKKRAMRFQKRYAQNALKNKRGYPVLHKFTVAVPSVQCEHCHNNNGVGSEFEGLFAKPDRPKASHEKTDAETPVLYGKEHEFLLPDIHRERGMHCIDCHGAADIKPALPEPLEPPQEGAPGAQVQEPPPAPKVHAGVMIRCEDCHGTHAKGPDGIVLDDSNPETQALLKAAALNPNLKKKLKSGDSILLTSTGAPMPHIKREKDRWVLYSKVSGEKHDLPVLHEKNPPLGHRIRGHMNTMECATCHARWSASEWGMHVIREGALRREAWKNWQVSDPTLDQLMAIPVGRQTPTGMLDWLSAKPGPNRIQGNWIRGIYWDILTEASWKDMILGKNHRGKYSILKPRYQYFLTDRANTAAFPQIKGQVPITRNGQTGLIMVPHTPHTIRKTVRRCESCHENTVSAGLGDSKRKSVLDARRFWRSLETTRQVPPDFQLKQMVAGSGAPLQNPVPSKQIRFLNGQEIHRLRTLTNSYRAFRYLDLRKMNFPRLLLRQEFPYDETHRNNEYRFGPPPRDENYYYDLSSGQLLAGGIYGRGQTPVRPEPAPETGQPSFPEPVVEPSRPLPPATVTEDGNPIVEFFSDIFR